MGFVPSRPLGRDVAFPLGRNSFIKKSLYSLFAIAAALHSTAHLNIPGTDSDAISTLDIAYHVLSP
jgi:hypothetical protein